MKKLTLAVISDLHVGANARGRDLAPDPSRARALDDRYVEGFCAFVQENHWKPDFLLVPGDATETSQPVEVEGADAALQSIAKAMGLGEDRIAFVPGNHDVDWSHLVPPDPTGLRWAQRYSALRHPAWLFPRISGAGSTSLFEAPYFSVWDWPELLVIGYNSAWHDDPEKVHHCGHCGEEHLKALRDLLASLDLASPRPKVFMVHHHPVLYSEPLPDEPELSAMINAENLLSELRSRRFDILVHGHRHFPRVSTHLIDSAAPMLLVGAGTFSLLLPHKWSGIVANQFHLIEIADRWPDTGCLRGRVRSWAYLPTWGWVESNEMSHGIAHEKPFGTYLTPRQVEKLLVPLLAEVFTAGDWADSEMLLSKEDVLRYVPPERLADVLMSLEGRFSYKFVRKERQEFVLLRDL